MSEPGEGLDVLAVVAHPDDAELLCGGTLAAAADRGRRTGVVTLTRGERATRGTPEVRDEEAARAAEVLGLTTRRALDLPDAQLVNTPEARRAVVGVLRELRPRVLILPWIRGRHPDHRVAAELGYDAAYLAGLRRLDAPGEPHRPHKVVHALAFREDAVRPTFVVDITDAMERKLEALACFASQFEGVRGIGEVFPGGDRPLPEQVRVQCARYGSLIRCAYGEPFWSRETMRVDDIAAVEVSTF